jgi:thioredoxin 1
MATATFIQDEAEFNSLLASEPLMVVDCTALGAAPANSSVP